ncbi:hypothetical protein J7T55_000420 [Diaporthe amygdali]|uniref:uncharacterized protein n=1 Tax=Phomopsis amygdali TaxID=1214568 RepID=UPI0022FDCF83|nr:uncharacterized protein J7T55_000420 [Diaporthe amygdali]KAJ0109494.1 hypothetical protein J7T55_000420 [Diaporthe amygdali]
MAHQQPEGNELAVTRIMLEQVIKQLAQRDKDISFLKEELARLHRKSPSADVATPYSTDSAVVESAWGDKGFVSTPGTPTSITAEYARSREPSVTSSDDGTTTSQHMGGDLNTLAIHNHTEASSDECGESQHEDEVSGDSWAYQPAAPSSTVWDNQSSTSTVRENESPGPITWDEGYPDDSGTYAWANNTAPSWVVEGSNSPGANDEVFQPGEPPKWRSLKLRPESKSWLHPLSFWGSPHTMSDARYKDLIDLHAIPLVTRLEEDDWLNSSLENVRVDDFLLFRLLTRGRELAQKCLWTYMDKNRPHIRDRAFPGGWHQVRLEVTVMREILEFRCLSYRENRADLAYDAVFNVIPLRHLTCHWNQGDLGWSRPAPRVVDYHLKNVQKLAIHFYDEEKAMEARKLRDEARRLVEDTVSELETLEPLFDEYAWKYHHEQMFEQIRFARDEGDPDLFKYPDVIFRAADAWWRRRSSEVQTILVSENQTPSKPEDRQEKPQVEKTQTKSGVEEGQVANLRRKKFTVRKLSRRHSICSIETYSYSVSM